METQDWPPIGTGYPPTPHPPTHAHPAGYGGGYGGRSLIAASRRVAISSEDKDLFTQLPGPLPAGQCYCRFDVAANAWALQEPVCKASLYARAAALASADLPTGLPVTADMLDQHYARAAATPAPFHKEIARFMQRDCTPAPPCSCAAKAVATAAGAKACYAEVLLYGAGFQRVVPYDVLLSAFSGDARRVGEATKWLESDFAEASCDAYSGSLYTMAALAGVEVPEVEQQTAQPDVAKAVATNSLKAAVPSLPVQQLLSQPIVIAMLAAMFLAGIVAALAVAAFVRRTSSNDIDASPLLGRGSAV
jgi:hypothetical protein